MTGECWNIGGLFAHDAELIRLHDAHAACLPRLTVFGGLACHWHGGRIADYSVPAALLPCVLHLFEEYNRRGMGVRLVFSAPDAGDRLDDPVGNALADMAAQSGRGNPGLNGVIVSDDRLAGHIRKKWPQLALTCSMLRPAFECAVLKDSPAYYNELADRYDVVVPVDDRGKAWEFLAQLRRPEKFEILANAVCLPACPLRAEHYALNMAVERFPNAENQRKLESLIRWCDSHRKAEPLRLARKDIERLRSMGFRHFKIAGRAIPWARLHDFLSAYLLPENTMESTDASSQSPVLA